MKATGFNAVCVFVNDKVNAEIITELKTCRPCYIQQAIEIMKSCVMMINNGRGAILDSITVLNSIIKNRYSKYRCIRAGNRG